MSPSIGETDERIPRDFAKASPILPARSPRPPTAPRARPAASAASSIARAVRQDAVALARVASAAFSSAVTRWAAASRMPFDDSL
jgi:hypothetical protein